MKMQTTRFPSPVLDAGSMDAYSACFGEYAETFVEILEVSPPEMAVLSRMMVHLAGKMRKED